ncbi:hypothetical protein PFISCL1PPCAC_15911, partial [Pristionchus fissidentatus]
SLPILPSSLLFERFLPITLPLFNLFNQLSMDKPTSSTSRDAQDSSPAKDDSAELVSTLSLHHLQKFLEEWSCVGSGCKGPGRYRGGWGPHHAGIPFVLPCGHYICEACIGTTKRNNKARINKYPYECGFNKGMDGSGRLKQCPIRFSSEELKELPIAHHIQEFVNVFRFAGIHCNNCTESGRQCQKFSKELTALRKTHFRFPRNLMTCCTHKDCMEIVYNNLMNNLGNRMADICDPSTQEHTHVDVKNNFSITPICVFCAPTAHPNHVKDMTSIKNVEQFLKRFRGDGLPSKKESHAKNEPWHLGMLPTREMKEFIKKLMTCQAPNCNNTYTRDRYPVIIDCGHHVCIECEKRMRGKNPHHSEDCGREDCAFAKLTELKKKIIRREDNRTEKTL